MKSSNIIVNGIDTLSLYHKDCLFDKECKLSLVSVSTTNGHVHIKTQCTKCGYQTGGFVSKSLIQPTDKIKQFNQRLYNAVYKKKLEEVYGMHGEDEEINKRVKQMKKAVKEGRLYPAKKRTGESSPKS